MVEQSTTESTTLRRLDKLEGKNKHTYALLSFGVVIVLTIVFYLVPDYYFLERVTADVVFYILKFYKYDVVYDGYYSEFVGEEGFITAVTEFLTGLDNHDALSPVIRSVTEQRRFAVVRACTGMQAGALLMSLIIVTPADPWQKVKATIYTILTLVITNFLRIALIVGMTVTLMQDFGVSYDAAWMWSHDVLGKPIGFFGTIAFAFIIEGQGVPILTTVSIWIDSLLDLFGVGKKESQKNKPEENTSNDNNNDNKLEKIDGDETNSLLSQNKYKKSTSDKESDT